MRAFLLALSLIVASSGPALADPAIPAEEIIKAAVDDYVRPEMAAFATAAGSTKAAMAGLCAAPSDAALSDSRASFAALTAAHARIEFLYFGPLSLDDRAASLLFWPDSKGIALKQVQQVLAAKDATATDPASLSGKSVALRGLGALEFVLYGTGSETLSTSAEPYRCAFGAAVATTIANTAATISAEWHDDGPDGPRAHMLAPRADAMDYRSTREVLERLAGALLVGNETLRDQRVLPILGTAEGKPKPKAALYWRSGQTLPALIAGFAGLRDFFNAARYPEAVKAKRWIASSTQFEFDNAINALGRLSGSMEQITADELSLQRLRVVVNNTRALDTLLGENLSGALGLTIGFSGLDGD